MLLAYPAIMAHQLCPRNTHFIQQLERKSLTSCSEWVKGLLAVPFVLYSQPTGVFGDGSSITQMAEESHRRYAEIMRDVELMIDNHSMHPCLIQLNHQLLTRCQFNDKATTAVFPPS